MDNNLLKYVGDGIKTVLEWTATVFKALINLGIGLPSEWKILAAMLGTLVSILGIRKIIKWFKD